MDRPTKDALDYAIQYVRDVYAPVDGFDLNDVIREVLDCPHGWPHPNCHTHAWPCWGFISGLRLFVHVKQTDQG